MKKKPNIKIKIYGPFTYEEDTKNQNYSIVYYDPEVVSFNEEGHMSNEDRAQLWNVGYVETIVTSLDENKWGFHRTPFYYGAHLPFAADY